MSRGSQRGRLSAGPSMLAAECSPRLRPNLVHAARGRRRQLCLMTTPALLPVCSPPTITLTPFTITCSTPERYFLGVSNVASSLKVSGLNTTTSALAPTLSRPRSFRPSLLAGGRSSSSRRPPAAAHHLEGHTSPKLSRKCRNSCGSPAREARCQPAPTRQIPS